MPNKLDTIIIDGVQYQLVPISNRNDAKSVVNQSLVDMYRIDDNNHLTSPPTPPLGGGASSNTVQKAVGKVSTYREKFKNRLLTQLDLVTKPSKRVKPPGDPSLDRFTHQGQSLFFGKGAENE